MKILYHRLFISLFLVVAFTLIFPLSTYSYAQQGEEKTGEVSLTEESFSLSTTTIDEANAQKPTFTSPEKSSEFNTPSNNNVDIDDDDKNNDNIITVTESPIEIESFSTTATDIKENLLPVR